MFWSCEAHRIYKYTHIKSYNMYYLNISLFFSKFSLKKKLCRIVWGQIPGEEHTWKCEEKGNVCLPRRFNCIFVRDAFMSNGKYIS